MNRRLFVVGTLVLVSALCSAQADRPLPSRVNRSANDIFLRPVALGDLLHPGESDLSRELVIVTEARQLGVAVEDAETWRLTHRFRKGDKNGEWMIDIPLVWRFGGILDGVVQSWEQDVMGYSNPNRVGFPKNQSEITLHGGTYGAAFGLGDVVVSRGIRLGDHASGRAWLKLPTGDPSKLLGSGMADVGASVEGRYRFAPKWSIGALAGIVFQSNGTDLTGARSVVDKETIDVAYRPNSRDAWILQVDSESAPFDTGIRPLDRPQRVTSLGYRRKMDARSDLTLYFSEDNDFKFGPFAASETGPDFTVGILFGIKY